MDFEKNVTMLLKKCDIREQLKQLLKKDITIYIDRPLGSTHHKYSNIIYPINYGYIKEIMALDNEYHDAYLLGVNKPVKEYIGKIYALIIREDDIEDKLIIVSDNKEYTIEELEKEVYFQEQYFKHKIIKF